MIDVKPAARLASHYLSAPAKHGLPDLQYSRISSDVLRPSSQGEGMTVFVEGPIELINQLGRLVEDRRETATLHGLRAGHGVARSRNPDDTDAPHSSLVA